MESAKKAERPPSLSQLTCTDSPVAVDYLIDYLLHSKQKVKSTRQ